VSQSTLSTSTPATTPVTRSCEGPRAALFDAETIEWAWSRTPMAPVQRALKGADCELDRLISRAVTMLRRSNVCHYADPGIGEFAGPAEGPTGGEG
jgi:hypothetical protein